MPTEPDPILLVLAVPALWTLCCALAWVGVVRHGYRVGVVRVERAAIRATRCNGLLRFAADEAVAAEQFRLTLKGGMLAVAWLSAWRSWERLDDTGWLWDWRDIVSPLVFLGMLVLLTHWSNWEGAHRPRPEPAEVPPC